MLTAMQATLVSNLGDFLSSTLGSPCRCQYRYGREFIWSNDANGFVMSVNIIYGRRATVLLGDPVAKYAEDLSYLITESTQLPVQILQEV